MLDRGGPRCRTAGSPAMMNGAPHAVSLRATRARRALCAGGALHYHDAGPRGPVARVCRAWRPPKAPWQSVTQWRQALAAEAWTHLTVREGEKGPVEIEMVRRRVQTRIERKRTGPEEWLVVTRRPLADDRHLGPRASRDATDQDARYR